MRNASMLVGGSFSLNGAGNAKSAVSGTPHPPPTIVVIAKGHQMLLKHRRGSGVRHYTAVAQCPSCELSRKHKSRRWCLDIVPRCQVTCSSVITVRAGLELLWLVLTLHSKLCRSQLSLWLHDALVHDPLGGCFSRRRGRSCSRCVRQAKPSTPAVGSRRQQPSRRSCKRGGRSGPLRSVPHTIRLLLVDHRDPNVRGTGAALTPAAWSACCTTRSPSRLAFRTLLQCLSALRARCSLLLDTG